ncbi:hypothetical protein [Aquicella lusitana]|uniref:Uncharacterized protein n=1 Tax=Aquicella lusitana TaxID=254246 RepID=A0A370GHQ9_9COXI|nr:hypothetical protein [Aquicella lusitana]RDI43348.1 hypothetical protein C8D86_1114 [Aquicella lusitana]VVC73498.1 hypothetical protein AQULUS_12410 [Aquicella lusitana]
MVIISRLKEETIHAVPAIIFFMITFNLINLTERLMMRISEPGFGSYLAASLGALLAGKLLIIVNSLPILNAFSSKPMIYNILWKFCVYGFFTLVFRMGEDLVSFYIHYSGLQTASGYIAARLVSPVFWAIQIWVLMLFAVYVVAAEFVLVVGRKRIRHMLFG